jgi:hypothetical protein
MIEEKVILVFKTKLSELFGNEEFYFPEKLIPSQLYNLSYKPELSRGQKELRFFVKESNNGAWFLDYYLKTDDYTRHSRINEKGNVEELENYDGQFGWPVFDDDNKTKGEHERIRNHNKSVYDILRAKGFENAE